MDEADDNLLIKQYLAGDNSSFETLYQRHKDRLYGYLRSLLPWNAAEVDELFQQTWIKAVRSLDSYREQGCFSAWIFRIGRNLLIDRQRKYKFHVPLDSDQCPVEPAAPAEAEPWRNLDGEELAALMKDAFATLPPDQQQVMLMRNDGKSFREIADALQCPLNTALAKMQYGIKKLRTFLSSVDRGGLIQ